MVKYFIKISFFSSFFFLLQFSVPFKLFSLISRSVRNTNATYRNYLIKEILFRDQQDDTDKCFRNVPADLVRTSDLDSFKVVVSKINHTTP